MRLRHPVYANRMTRRRKILFRLTLGGASVLAIQLIVLGFGGYGSTLPSSERILPAPVSAAIPIPQAIQAGTIASGSPINLSNVTVSARVPVPTRLLIPAIGVDTSLVPLRRNPDGTAQVPTFQCGGRRLVRPWSETRSTWTSRHPRPRRLLYGPRRLLPSAEFAARGHHHGSFRRANAQVRGHETAYICKGSLSNDGCLRIHTGPRAAPDHMFGPVRSINRSLHGQPRGFCHPNRLTSRNASSRSRLAESGGRPS
jgi:hypothetical protein